MSRARLSALMGVASAVVVVLIALAGADRPPPPGFWVVIVIAVAVGLLVWRGVPVLLDRRASRGTGAAVVAALLAGGVIGAALAGGLVIVGGLFGALGEPTTPTPQAGEVAVFVLVAAVAGGLFALLVAGAALALGRRS